MRKRYSYRSFLLGAAGCFVAAAPVTAQVPATPRALGMAGAYDAVSRGQEALFLNPAQLGWGDNPLWSVALPQVAVGATFVGPGFGDLPDIQNFDDISESRAREILATIPEEGTSVDYEVRAPVFVLQNGGFALGATYGSFGYHTLGKDIVELMFLGFDETRTDYRVGDSRGRRISYWDFAAGYGRQIGPVSVGLAYHFILGQSLVQTRLFEPRIDIQSRDVEVDYLSVASRGGRGHRIDVGLALQPRSDITLSATIQSAWSVMDWNENLRLRTATLRREDFQGETIFDVLDAYEKSDQPFDPEGAPLGAYEVSQGLFGEADFPAVLRGGVAWSAWAGGSLAANYRTSLTRGALPDAWNDQVAIGLQQALGMLELRAGAATNLEEGSLLSAGFSLGPIHLGLGKYENGEFAGRTSRAGWIATFGLSTRTHGTQAQFR